MTSCKKTTRPSYIIKPEFQTIIESADIEGSILIYDLNKSVYYSNDFEWAKKARLPASTFKIPHSLMALELGIVENENTVFKWNGDKRYLEIWEQDLTFKQAFHYSCVPCYQEIAKKIGVGRMNDNLEKFNYGNNFIEEKNLDNFWLQGQFAISQFQQIDFLKRFQQAQLPISDTTFNILKNMMIVKSNETYTIRAKTGLSVRSKNYNGWYVGYVETSNNTFFFATNISPLTEYNKGFNKLRKVITVKALELLNVL